RKAYGNALVKIFHKYPDIVVMDGETSNSTYSEFFAKANPNRYFEMFIAEQNMVGAAIGLARRGKIPFISTMSAFWTRAHDQIRMAGYARANIKICGSHVGVWGKDGASQMGLEDISLFRSVIDSVVLYPSDANSTQKLLEQMANHNGLTYIRTTRMDTPVIYDEKEKFEIGGSKTLKSSNEDKVTIIGAGITLHEALKAFEMLKKEGIKVRIVDLYSIKPLDSATLSLAARETQGLIVVEDHYKEGGIADAVRESLVDSKTPVYSLSVTKMPRSGKPEELLRYEGIDSEGIVSKVKQVLVSYS
ncbi:MAG: transketolase C-terminal domain-containing protein, partial [Patescibacteria group bacterium]